MDTPQIKLRRFSRNKQVEADPEPVVESQPSMVTEPSFSDLDDDGDDFLGSLKRDKFITEEVEEKKPKKTAKKKADAPTPTPAPTPKPDDGILADILGFNKPQPPKRAVAKKTPKQSSDEFADLFGNDPTPILGKDKRTLLTRIKQYRTLFSDELKSFKIKANASVEELQEYLDEMDVIVSVGGIQGMINEGFFTATGMVEAMTSRYESMNLTGTTELLRQNPEVLKLLKVLSIKYNTFGQASPEAQLTLVCLSTALLCRQQNLKRGQVRSILNTEI